MKKDDYADFDYVIEGIVIDLCQLARSKKRLDIDGWNTNVSQILNKIHNLRRYV